ncbi:aldehyde dehydrogenase [Chryseobacterium sp.]|uniref:aldehyde dehydrogenase n=1 Tax=Chryseobacterium sp. TaxID=1871047 RepID=UPI00289E1997|nr:aldehyde dehydrogenase [Chryseobacterium sp.]
MTIAEILQLQKKFFQTQHTKDVDFRIEQFEKFKDLLVQHQDLLYEATALDFGKSQFETFTTEISFILNDIDYYLKNLSSLSKPKKVKTNLANQIGSSKIHYEPLGNILVIGAWNYPYQLSFSPTVAAIAAGNCCIIKPSEIAENTMKAMAKLINENFPKEYLYVFEGGISETTEILKERFDKIFFTGSTKVGKIVYQAAAEHLTPVTLELGGKSPVIVTENADIEVAAKRIIWGKFLNAGQTCVAPDYILADEKIKNRLLEKLKFYIQKFNYQNESEHYTKIINEKNFDRIINLIDPKKIYFGGNSERENRFIEPTILNDINWNDNIMQEEIFGPLLPVIPFKDYNEALHEIMIREKPLSAYLFTNNPEEKDRFLNTISFGGGCINDVIMHLSNENLPFGGVGSSGMGNYHGKFGFETFSHQKAVLEKKTWGEPDLKYPPYTDSKKKWIKRLL